MAIRDGDAFVRARVLYYMQIGYYALDIREPMETRLALTPHYLEAFTGLVPSGADFASFSAYAAEHVGSSDFQTFRGET